MKYAIVLVAALALGSCINSSQKTQTTTVDMHTSQNSLDYKGVYTGVLPCADCEGIRTTITIADSTYIRSMVYLGKGDTTAFTEKGAYYWNEMGTAIILGGVKDAPNQYFVGENTLRQLDMKGEQITGENADKYVLRK